MMRVPVLHVCSVRIPCLVGIKRAPSGKTTEGSFSAQKGKNVVRILHSTAPAKMQSGALGEPVIKH